MDQSRIEGVTTREEALRLVDRLGAVSLGSMVGSWRGSGLPTGHPLDGLLEAYGWHGKRFDASGDVHPLLMTGPDGERYGLDPALAPMGLVLRGSRVLRLRPVAALGRRVLRLRRTTRPRARLRMVEHRGVLTATMTYDALPVDDHFRRVDDDTVLGVMEMRGMDPFFFVLRREPPRP